jgi:hypothetical protein
MAFEIIDSLFEILSLLMIDFLFYLLFLLVSNNDLFGSVLFSLFLVFGSLFSYLIDYFRGLRRLKEVC